MNLARASGVTRYTVTALSSLQILVEPRLPVRDLNHALARWRIPLLLLAAVVVVDAVSLAITPAVAFDPNAWIVWGREIVHGGLNTSGGPDWKPLPVLLDIPWAIFSTRGISNLYVWLFIARGGMLLGAVAVGLIAYRMEGWGAAVLAVFFTVVSEWWYFEGILGNSEPLMVAAIAGAVLAYDARLFRTSSLLLFAAALVRPEVWPFFLLWGMWLVYQDRRRLPYLVVLIVAVAVIWNVPSIVHSGSSVLSAANGAPAAGDAIHSSFPFAAVFWQALVHLATPTVGVLTAVACLIILSRTWRAWRADGLRGAIAAQDRLSFLAFLGLGVIFVVAAMAEAGFDGSPKYEIPGAGVLTIVSAVALMRLLRGRPQWLRVATVIVAAATALVFSFHALKVQHQSVEGHQMVIETIHTQLARVHCSGLRWTFVANRSQLADLAGQGVEESGHPDWFHAAAPPQFVYCAVPHPAAS
jgi:hypothetical protein